MTIHLELSNTHTSTECISREACI
uniref:Uncharacterized protein n=1 Tax=Arundo donax TaxID=35708 RepID=A0A0A9AC68_ARUDO